MCALAIFRKDISYVGYKDTPAVEAVNFSTLLVWEQKWVEAVALPLCVLLPTNNQLENRMLDYMGLFEPSRIFLTFLQIPSRSRLSSKRTLL